ncbi:4Fe-4S dicluster domain-containing protein [Massilia sp. W12]|uniref:4Fe-4S dicluster domain-containing protein n=1 Tax=Massilia sp. W12 TaxID=3126507 RepID=UPI0030CE099D
MSQDSACKQTPGRFTPEVHFGKCEGRAVCVAVCPEQVFEIRRIAPEDLAQLNFLQRLKQKIHGGQVAYAVRAEACAACGKCVTACPENAITLRRAAP